MTLWLQVRGLDLTLGAMALTLVGLALPASAVAATPSPAGATVAAACLLALAVPVVAGWGCTRGDQQLESVSTRSVRHMDLVFVVLAVGVTSAAAFAMHRAGLALAGSAAARAALAYLGLMLLAYPFGSWRIATLVPSVYLLAVIVMGRGEDINHPAVWAWIASDAGDVSAWMVTFGLLGIGLVAYVVRSAPSGSSMDD